MNKKTIAVIFGGRSPEYDVSLKSAHSVINAIDKEKFEVILVGITKTGDWYRYLGDASDIPNDNWHTDKKLIKKAALSPSKGDGLLEFESDAVKVTKVDVVFPVLHGRYGEDGTIQGLCELAGIPIVGCGSAASALCIDKVRAYKIAEHGGIKIPRYVRYENIPTITEIISDAGRFKPPIFVKPVKTGSSIGVTKVDDSGDLISAIKYAFEFDDEVLLEESVLGKELGCAVFGNSELKTGKLDEVEVKSGFFDYEEKYSLKTAKIFMPARIGEITERRVIKTAKKLYKLLGCKGYARVDMFLTEDEEIIFNEVNTIPGFTQFSRFPNMCKGIDMDFKELVDKLIELGVAASAEAAQ